MGESFVSGVRQLAEKVMSPTSPADPFGNSSQSPADQLFGGYEPVSLAMSMNQEPVQETGQQEKTSEVKNVSPSPPPPKVTAKVETSMIRSGGWISLKKLYGLFE